MGRVHALPGTTFSNVAARLDYPSEQKAVLTLRAFERILALEILGPYHNAVHASLDTTPAAAWAGGTAARTVRLPVDPAAFVLDFLPFEERVIPREGVRLFNVTYFDGALAPLLDGPARTCRIKYDPRNMSAVFVELPAGGHLRVPCADLSRPAVTLWEQRVPYRRCAQRGVPVSMRRLFSPRSKRSAMCSPRPGGAAKRPDAPSPVCLMVNRRRRRLCSGRPRRRYPTIRPTWMRQACPAWSSTKPGRRSSCRDRGQAVSRFVRAPRTCWPAI